MAAIIDGGKLRLSGDVGMWWSDDHFTAADVALCLMQIDPAVDLPVYLNSGGGYATEGAAIHAQLAARPGATHIIVEGIAASAASLIAMAGETVTMSAGSIMMIHDPSADIWGTAADHEKAVEQLDALGTAYARVYAAKSGKSPANCRAIMKRETWFTPQQAVAEGFADATLEAGADDTPVPVAAFDYRLYAHAPKRLVTMAAQKNWSFAAKERAPMPGSPRQNQEPSMTVQTNGGVDAAELARLREENATMKAATAARERRDAIMALPEAKGREAQAAVLAETSITPEQAKAILAAAPAPTEPPPPTDIPEPTAYERSRVTGAGMQGGKPPAAKGDKAVLAAAVARTNKRR